MPFVPDALPWYRSKVIVGAAVSILCKVLLATGLIGEVSPELAGQTTDLLLLVFGGIGDLVAIYGRVSQKHAPTITGTQQ